MLDQSDFRIIEIAELLRSEEVLFPRNVKAELRTEVPSLSTVDYLHNWELLLWIFSSRINFLSPLLAKSRIEANILPSLCSRSSESSNTTNLIKLFSKINEIIHCLAHNKLVINVFLTVVGTLLPFKYNDLSTPSFLLSLLYLFLFYSFNSLVLDDTKFQNQLERRYIFICVLNFVFINSDMIKWSMISLNLPHYRN